MVLKEGSLKGEGELCPGCLLELSIFSVSVVLLAVEEIVFRKEVM